MRNWIKIGIITTVSILILSLGLIGFSYFYYKNTKTPNNQNQVEQITKPEIPIIPEDIENKPNIEPPNIDSKPNKPPSIKPNPNLPNVDENNNPSLENNKPNDKPTVDENKPTIDNKPDKNPPTEDDKSDPEFEIKPIQYSIISNFDKYKYIQNVTDYQTFFSNNQQLKFNEIRIKTNTFSYIKEAIIKSMKINLNDNILKIKIYYQLDTFSFNKLKLFIDWSIKSNNSAILEKKYYDNIHINLKKV